MARDPARFYRFAFYGRSGSGKSCYLGMLALGAPSEYGITCDYLPVEVPKPAPSNNQPSPAEREALGLHAGKEWVERILDRLRQGDVPEPNPPVVEAALPTLDFRVGDPSRGPLMVRLADYSGELINPLLEDDPESVARKLRSALAESDGFLVFAEVPRRNGLAADAELRLLREAFASLHESKADPITTPVCVVLTKWDRYSTIDRQSPDTEQRKVEEFLAEFSEYEKLVQSICNAVAAQPPAHDAEETGTGSQGPTDSLSLSPSGGQGAGQASDALKRPAGAAAAATPPWGLKRGNTRVFPTSSFGSARLLDGKELPAGQPFGLLEPLVWLAERRDALDLADLDQRCTHGRWWWLPFAWLAPSARAARRKLARLRRRIPEHTPGGRHLAALRRAVIARFAVSRLAAVLVLLLLASSLAGLYRNHQFRTYVTMADDPHLAPERLDQALRFFQSYATWGRWNGPLAPPADEARQQLDLLNRRREDVYWPPVESASDPAEKAKAAEEYLERLPNGEHVAEAHSIVQHWKAEQARREGEEQNRQWLEQREQQLAKADSRETLDKLIEALTSGFPAPQYATPEHLSQRDALLQKAQQYQADLAWQEFLKSYRGHLSKGDFVSAAEALAAHNPRDSQWQDLAQKFPDEVHRALSAQLPKHLRNTTFDQARKVISKTLEALRGLESALRPEEPKLAEAMLEAQRKVHHTWETQVDEQEDEHLYVAVQTRKSKHACDTYLEDAPLKAMKRSVEEYRKYLAALEGELEVTVALKVLWDKEYQGDWLSTGDNYCTVWVDGNKVFESKAAIPEAPGSLSGEICSFPLKGKTGRSFEIMVSILEDDDLLEAGNDEGGSGSQTCTIGDLNDEVRIPLRSKEGGFTNYAVLTITSGWPSEPALPAWQKAE